VGSNIVDGVKDILEENPNVCPRIIENENPSVFDARVFAHSNIGQNSDAQSKLKGFTDSLERGIGNKADVAFFKFCYVDITARSDTDELFCIYKKNMARLQDKFPNTMLLRVTVPLTLIETGLKVKARRTLGLKVKSCDDNIKRSEFNDRLREDCGMKELIFDLAMIESTHPDGSKAIFKDSGKTYDHMASDYTYGGGHLNERGLKIIAEKLLIFLANRFQSLHPRA
jgi:hypothetical protein